MSLNFDTLFGPYQDRSTNIISYDWVDVDSATGYVSYDGFSTRTSVGVFFILDKSSERNNLFSYGSVLGAGAVGHTTNTWNEGDYTTLTKVLDLDFDTTSFKKARTIRGKAYLKVPFAVTTVGTGTITAVYIIAKVRKWNGTTETDIVSVQSPTEFTTTAATDLSSWFVLPIEIPETVFSINDQLRLTIELYIDMSADTDVLGWIAHDPQDNADTGIFTSGLAAGRTRLVFNCPFKIETGS